MMKRAYYIGLFAAVLVTACKDGYDPNADPELAERLYPALKPYCLQVGPSTIYADPKGEDIINALWVESENTPWHFSALPDWVSLSTMSGSTSCNVDMTVAPNPSADSVRTTIFYLQADVPGWPFSAPVAVEQTRAIPELHTDSLTYHMPGNTNELDIKVEANFAYSVKVNRSDWSAEPDYSAGVLRVSAPATGDAASCGIKLYHPSYGAIDYWIEIVKAGGDLSVTEKTLEVPQPGGKCSVAIQSYGDWTATASESWMHLENATGQAGAGTLNFEVLPNDQRGRRLGNIAISNGGTVVSILLVQEGIQLTLPSSVTISSDGGQSQVHVQSNVEWQAEADADWLTMSPTAGTGDGAFTISCQPNPTEVARYATVTCRAVQSGVTATMTVVQKSKFFETSTTLVNFASTPGHHAVEFNCDVPWTLTIEPTAAAWLGTDKSAGDGSAVIDISVADNATADARAGTITITPEGLSPVQLAVRQKGRSLECSPLRFVFYAEGGSADLAINADGPFKISCSEPWITITQQQGALYEVAVAGHTGAVSRRGNISVDITELASGKIAQEIDVVQLANGASFFVYPYPDTPGNWEADTEDALDIKIIQYTNDIIWD